MSKLHHVEKRADVARAQRRLEREMRAALISQGSRTIGFPGGHQALPLLSNGDGGLWAAFGGITDGQPGRYWNVFGVFDAAGRSQDIAVEINPPAVGLDRRVEGFFARDSLTDEIFLMHGGGIGGGRTGVTRDAFLADSGLVLVDVETSDGRGRRGLAVGRLGDPRLVGDVGRFVALVASFKARVRDERTFEPIRRRAEARRRYEQEFAGWKALPARAATTYLTRHGEVVEALRRHRIAAWADANVFNTALLDLVVEREGRVAEVYEVKSSLTRQSLYTAVGQLMVHGHSIGTQARRVLVVPEERGLPPDVAEAAGRLKIKVATFAFEQDGSVRLDLPE